MIRPCTCKHDYQDQKYGPQKRVHNPCKNGEKARCTVCGDEKFIHVIKEQKKEVKKP